MTSSGDGDATFGGVQNEPVTVFGSRRRHLPRWFTSWWMSRIAARYCPCHWPVRVRSLIRLCGWIDDEHARHEFIDFARWYIPTTVATTSSAPNVKVTWSQPPRRKHSEGQS